LPQDISKATATPHYMELRVIQYYGASLDGIAQSNALHTLKKSTRGSNEIQDFISRWVNIIGRRPP
jgi:hypothetical protein